MGASLLALAKSIYYLNCYGNSFGARNAVSRGETVSKHISISKMPV